jgi:hypothetical protein
MRPGAQIAKWAREFISSPSTTAESVARFHVRATIAFVILALGGIAGLAKETVDYHNAICSATNRATHKVERLADILAAPNAYPKHASPSVRAAVDATNHASQAKRESFRKVTHRLLDPEMC